MCSLREVFFSFQPEREPEFFLFKENTSTLYSSRGYSISETSASLFLPLYRLKQLSEMSAGHAQLPSISVFGNQRLGRKGTITAAFFRAGPLSSWGPAVLRENLKDIWCIGWKLRNAMQGDKAEEKKEVNAQRDLTGAKTYGLESSP